MCAMCEPRFSSQNQRLAGIHTNNLQGQRQCYNAGADFRKRYLNASGCTSLRALGTEPSNTCLSPAGSPGATGLSEPKYGAITDPDVTFSNYDTVVVSSALDRTLLSARSFLTGGRGGEAPPLITPQPSPDRCCLHRCAGQVLSAQWGDWSRESIRKDYNNTENRALPQLAPTPTPTPTRSSCRALPRRERAQIFSVRRRFPPGRCPARAHLLRRWQRRGRHPHTDVHKVPNFRAKAGAVVLFKAVRSESRGVGAAQGVRDGAARVAGGRQQRLVAP